MDDRNRKRLIDGQKDVWEASFREEEMFGGEESFAARRAVAAFERSDARCILELGCGQGRDTLFFARKGFEVTAADYSAVALESVRRNAGMEGVASFVRTVRVDARRPLPFADGFFDGCYSHMLLCMALTLKELLSLSSEIRRVLRRGGRNIYSVRHKGDAHWRRGIHRGEDMYEHDGYIVRFFDERTVALLAEGFAVVEITEFEEGELPRRLWYVEEEKTLSASERNMA